MLEQEMAGHAVSEMEVVRQKKSGELIDVSLSTSPIYDASGRLMGSMGTLVDISGRKHAEREREGLLIRIREQAQQLEQVLAAVPTGVVMLNAEGRVMRANPPAEESLQILAGVQMGDIVTHLGDHPLADLLASLQTKGLWHEIQVDERSFQVIAKSHE